MAGIHDDWLASGEEQAIEPELRVCDPHHHLWDYPNSRYLAGEFARAARAHGVGKSVFDQEIPRKKREVFRHEESAIGSEAVCKGIKETDWVAAAACRNKLHE